MSDNCSNPGLGTKHDTTPTNPAIETYLLPKPQIPLKHVGKWVQAPN